MNILSQEHLKSAHQATEHTAYVAPYVDIESTDSGYVLRAEMPGVNRDSIEITVEDGNLVLVGQRQPLSAGGEPLHRESRQHYSCPVHELFATIDTTKL